MRNKFIFFIIISSVLTLCCSDIPDYKETGKVLPEGTISINDNHFYTQSVNADLNLDVDNADEMSFSTDGTTYTAWEPYSATKSVTLPSGHGQKTVYGKFRNADGESVITDTIVSLDEEKIVASGGVANELFGGGDWGYTTSNVFLSADGNTMITSGLRNNKIYVYRRNLDLWEELVFSNGECVAGDNLGQSLTCTPDGIYLVVGAINKACLYIYKKSGIGYEFESKIESPTPGFANDFSVDLSISDDGNRLLVGSWRNGYGKAFLYKRSGVNWNRYTFEDLNSTAPNYYGLGVKISGDGNTIAISAPVKYSSEGALFIYKWNGTIWEGLEYRTSDGEPDDFFGRHISMSYDGNKVIAGTRIYSSGNTNQGAAYLFEWNGTSYDETKIFKASDGITDDRFGFCVAMSSDGNSVVISAPFNMGSSEHGKAYIFRYRNSEWIEEAIVSASDGASGEFYGNITAISGDGSVIAVSASLDNIGANVQQGSVYLYY